MSGPGERNGEQWSPVQWAAWIDENAPVIAAALRLGAEHGASDVHIRAGQRPWIQVGGPLEEQEGLDVVPWDQVDAAVRWAGGQETSQTVVFPIEHRQRWRTQTLMDYHGPGIVFRRLSTELPDFDKILGGRLPVVQTVAGFGEGLVVVTGETGSGKTTTLSAIVDLINRTRPVHILTIEDPIEVLYRPQRALFTQREIGRHVENAERALFSALRAAPDVILLGELRTEKEADLCLDAAMSGHLVLTTMHARDVGTVAERIIGNKGLFGQSKLAQALRMVISQRLVPDIYNPRKRHLYAEVVPTSQALQNLIRIGKLSEISEHVSSNYKGGLDAALARGVIGGEISLAAAMIAGIDGNEVKNFSETLPPDGDEPLQFS